MNLGLEYADDDSACLIVVSYDPGGTTGWAVHRVPIDVLIIGGFKAATRDPRFAWTSGQFFGHEDDMVDSMIDVLKSAYVLGDYGVNVQDRFVVVMEDFILRRSESDRSLLSPVRIEAKFSRDLYKTGLRWAYVKQSASDAKNVVSDARLQAWNLYKPGSEHARDAQRHGILAARRYASDIGFRFWVDKRQPMAHAAPSPEA